ncbi:MAG TPA: hypothetical protein VGR43_02385, partial [Dehalococcoidia bacterium]|nr:hypothetical protein [Dehalococcoidia bacterium]
MSFTTGKELRGVGKEAPAPYGLTLGPALIERTANAVEAEVRAFAPSAAGSGFSHGLDPAAVRASVTGGAGASESRPASRSPRDQVSADLFLSLVAEMFG